MVTTELHEKGGLMVSSLWEKKSSDWVKYYETTNCKLQKVNEINGLPFNASDSKIHKFHVQRQIKSNCCLALLILVGTISGKSDCLCICIKKECIEAGTVTSVVHCTPC